MACRCPTVISRFTGPEQKEPEPAIFAGGRELRSLAGTFVKHTFALRTEGEFNETMPFIGIPAVLFLLYALLSRTRSAAYWGLLLLATALHYAGSTTPFIYVHYLLMPYYKLMRTFGYYSGYVTLAATVLAGIGVMRLSRTLSRPSFSRDRADQLGLLAALLLAATIVFLFPAGNGAVSLAALAAIAVILTAARLITTRGRGGAVLVHLLLLVVLAAAATNLFVGRGQLNRLQMDGLVGSPTGTVSVGAGVLVGATVAVMTTTVGIAGDGADGRFAKTLIKVTVIVTMPPMTAAMIVESGVFLSAICIPIF